MSTDTRPRSGSAARPAYNEGRLTGHRYPASEAGEVTPSQLHGRPIRPETHEELVLRP